jgi:hypothetical protein
MHEHRIDVNAERLVLSQVLGEERGQPLPILYAALPMRPSRIDDAVAQLLAAQVLQRDASGVSPSIATARLDALGAIHL